MFAPALRGAPPLLAAPLVLAAALLLATAPCGAAAGVAAAPPTLRETGLYADAAMSRLQPGVLGFTPQYPLWTDGAEKRRWIRLPAGAQIDARRPDAWQFPRGTRLWKEFAHDGHPVETRYIERRRDGSWLFAAYVWNEAGTEARLAPERGIAALALPHSPQRRYAIPSRSDCLACHGHSAAPVLGFTALQLSPARDPLAAGARAPRPGDVDLRSLVERGLLRGLPPALLAEPPRIAADSPVERAALGYLHGNCAHCHNSGGAQVPVALSLAQRVVTPQASRAELLASALQQPGRYRPADAPTSAPADGDADKTAAAPLLIAPGHPEASVLLQRMQTREPLKRMPPLGSFVPDEQAIAIVSRWIAALPELPPSHGVAGSESVKENEPKEGRKRKTL